MINEKLRTIDVKNLDKSSFPYDLRRDLHLYMEFITNNEIRRHTRNNLLTKVDYKKIARYLGRNELLNKQNYDAISNNWILFIDSLARDMGFTDWEQHGNYQGATSTTLSYSDNYIECNQKRYDTFLNESLNQHEKALLLEQIKYYSHRNNELLTKFFGSKLDRFRTYGCATGVLPYINFFKARNKLLEILSKLETDKWYSTESLINYMHENHPYFLISRKPKYKYESDKKQGRYVNFKEWNTKTNHQKDIQESQKDSFARVEGRFIERFLEGIPYIMDYVKVAYDPNYQSNIAPSLGRLKAFKIDTKLIKLFKDKIEKPVVTIQPNFEIRIDTQFHPIKLLKMLKNFGELISEDQTYLVKLQKKKVLDFLVKHKDFNLVNFLKDLSDKSLPKNIEFEIEEWVGHTDKFLLFSDCALYEGKAAFQNLDDYTVEKINDTIRIVNKPEDLIASLEKAKLVPVRIHHNSDKFESIPEEANSIMTTLRKKNKPSTKNKVMIKQSNLIQFNINEKDFYHKVVESLLEQNFKFDFDENKQTLIIAKEKEESIKEIFYKLSKNYNLNIKTE
ncbi:MAG: hypothetical protein K9N00_01260 [Candidatus Marinimicrobia bacterium]|nr:hypothetical protein [Candidatus Neomarinimicrobiota bacterium]